MIYREEAMMRWRRCRKQLALAILASSITAVAFLFNRKENAKESHKGLNLSNFQSGMISGQTGKGFLNLAIWEEICGHEMQSLKEFPLFPHGPTSRLLISKFRLRFTQEFKDFGLRIFGFLRPNESGNYSFCLSSIINGTSELWISSDSKPENSKLITNTTDGLTNCYDNKNRIQLLAGDTYFLEFLHKQGLHDNEKKVNEIFVKWRSSSWEERELREIPSNVLFAEINESKDVRTLNQYPAFVLPRHAQRRSPTFVNEEVERRSQMYSLPFIDESDSRDLFPPFSYNPSYLVKGPLRRYQSTWEMHYTSIYPFDHGDILWKERGDFRSFGNDRLDDEIAQAVVSQVWTQIKKRHSRKYSLVRTLNVEENHDQGTGDRYLVELELKEISGRKSVRFSEYVYRPWGLHTLCTPVGVAWNKSAVINILLTTGNNQGRWILHFLDNMARIYDRTKDANFNVVIVDFDSKDIDVENALKKAAIPSYQYANIEGNFSRALGLQKAAEMVRDPNSILFAMDLHLDIPYHFLDDVRKHCVQHKIAYSPILIRLDCGATPSQPFGRWEIHGLGLIGLYKSDWDKAGGMNIEEFKDKWGGEDWELSDRILEAGMEIERLKMMHFFHYFHSKKGMWNTMNDQLKSRKTLV